MAMTVATDDAAQMLEAGWTVRRIESSDDIEWRSPEGISGSDFRSKSLDRPPLAAVKRAKELGQLVPRDRVQAASSENMERNATEELRQELHDLKVVLAATVLSNGGKLYVGDIDLHAAKDVNLESWKDERNRRWVLRCEAS